MGLYTFEARPPFRPKRISPRPIMWPHDSDRPGRLRVSVCFPCGAILREGKWIVSYGYMDHECRLAFFDFSKIEQTLVAV